MIRKINLYILVSFGLMMQSCHDESPSGPSYWVEVSGDGIHSPAIYSRSITTDYNGLFVWNNSPSYSTECELFYHTNIDKIWTEKVSSTCPPGRPTGLRGGNLLATGKFLLNSTAHGIYYSDNKGTTWQKSPGSTDLYISCMNYNPLTGVALAKVDSLVQVIVWGGFDWMVQYK